jgi:hypothetical protein
MSYSFLIEEITFYDYLSGNNFFFDNENNTEIKDSL